MTVIRPNSISGITSLTAHRGSIDFYAHDGSAATFTNINSNVTSGVSTFASLNITGDLDVGGALTYEDVTNVDSIGIVTARNGIDVTGGTVTITTGSNSASPAGSGDNLVIKDSNGCGLSILSGNGNSQNIYLGSVSDNDAVRLEGFYNSGSPYFNIYTGGSQRLRIKSDGDVYIGNIAHSNEGGANSSYRTLTLTDTTNGAQLHLRGQSPKLFLDVTSGGNGEIYYDSGDLRILSGEPGTTSSEKLRITSGGSVGFNTSFTQSSKTVHIAGDYRSVTQNVADEGLIFQSFATASTGDVYPGISWTGNPTALGRARASINAIATNDNNGSDIVFLTRNAADGTELEVADDEKVRITSGGKVGVGVAAPVQMMEIVNTSGTGSQIQFRDTSTAQGNNNGFRVGYNGSGGQLWNFESTYIRFATSNAERVRISSAGDATFKHKVNIGDSHTGGEILSLGKSSGTSYMAFHNGGANMGFIGYADQLISGGGSNELGIRSQDDISFATGGNAETLRLTTAGYAYFGSYPTTHTVMGGSPIKVRSGAGAWGISIGMRYSQNDYGYIGFSDMNGTENLGDIHVNRTGTNTGRMAFSTNNGSGSLQRLRIEPSGNVIITDDGTIRDQRLPLVITGRGFGHGTTSQGTTQDAIYLTAGASGNYSTLTLTVDKSSWGSVAYEIHAAAYNGRHLHRVGGFYQNGNNISGDHGTTTASSGSSFSISAPASQQFRMTISGNTWTHPSAWVRLVLSGSGFLRSDLISFAWS